MIFVKLLAPFLTAIVALIQLLLQFKVFRQTSFTDRRTGRHRLLAGLASLGVVVLAATTGFIIWDDSESNQRQTRLLDDQSTQLREQTGQLRRLNQQIGKLDASLRPFRDLATARYPALADNDALEKLVDYVKTLDARTADLEIRADTLRLELADRNITGPQRMSMLEALRTRAPGNIGLQSLLSAGDEALRYALKLAAVFREAQWDVTDPTGRGAFDVPISGVFIVVGRSNESADLANFIADVLIAGEIASAPVALSPSNNVRSGGVEIWVAGKVPAAR